MGINAEDKRKTTVISGNTKRIIGQESVVFFLGEKYVFRYAGNGEWEVVSGQRMIPPALIENLIGLDNLQ